MKARSGVDSGESVSGYNGNSGIYTKWVLTYQLLLFFHIVAVQYFVRSKSCFFVFDSMKIFFVTVHTSNTKWIFTRILSV